MTKKTATAMQQQELPIAKQHSIVRKAQAVAVRAKSADVVPVNMLAVIAHAAADKRVDSSKMRELLDMQKEVVAEEARVAFNHAFIAMSPLLPEIDRDGRIVITDKSDRKRVIQKTPYATYNEINRVCRPILHEHGFALSASTDAAADGKLLVIVTLKHERGHQERTLFPLPLDTSGSKNNVQGVGSSMSYGRRYGAIALLNLITKLPSDQDNDGYDRPQQNGKQQQRATDPFPGDIVDHDPGPAVITQAQHDELREAIDDCGIGIKRFCEYYQIAKVADLPAVMLREALKSCENYKNRAQR